MEPEYKEIKDSVEHLVAYLQRNRIHCKCENGKLFVLKEDYSAAKAILNGLQFSRLKNDTEPELNNTL